MGSVIIGIRNTGFNWQDACILSTLTHLSRMEFPISINWTSPFTFSWLLGGVFHFYSNFNKTFYKQTVETLFAYAPQKGR